MLRRLLPEGSHAAWRDPTGKIALAEVAYSPSWVGRRLTKLEAAAGARIALIRRNGDGTLPGPDTVVQEGDLLYVAAEVERLPEVEQVFAGQPEEH
jgi:trk system potassium uptake protein TrkA